MVEIEVDQTQVEYTKKYVSKPTAGCVKGEISSLRAVGAYASVSPRSGRQLHEDKLLIKKKPGSGTSPELVSLATGAGLRRLFRPIIFTFSYLIGWPTSRKYCSRDAGKSDMSIRRTCCGSK